jgi:hypothetical protein
MATVGIVHSLPDQEPGRAPPLACGLASQAAEWRPSLRPPAITHPPVRRCRMVGVGRTGAENYPYPLSKGGGYSNGASRRGAAGSEESLVARPNSGWSSAVEDWRRI